MTPEWVTGLFVAAVVIVTAVLFPKWVMQLNPLIFGLAIWPAVIIVQQARAVRKLLRMVWPHLSVALKGFSLGVMSGIVYEAGWGRRRRGMSMQQRPQRSLGLDVDDPQDWQ